MQQNVNDLINEIICQDMTNFLIKHFFSRSNISSRVAAIEKWTAVADICRCLHNFNGVLQVCAAFTNAAVFRLKKTWDKVPKTVSNFAERPMLPYEIDKCVSDLENVFIIPKCY